MSCGSNECTGYAVVSENERSLVREAGVGIKDEW